MNKIRVKFCGITSKKDAEDAIAVGADALGFVFFEDSPRFILPEHVEAIIKDLPPFITTVGIFVNEKISFIEQCVEECGLHAVQLHGDEDVKYCLKLRSFKGRGLKLIKAIRVKNEDSLSSIEGCPADAVLLDTYKCNLYGGTGESFDRGLVGMAKEYGRRIVIAGGINPDNVYNVIKQITPYAVDVSSGIESSPGRKNVELMEEFIKEVRRAETETV